MKVFDAQMMVKSILINSRIAHTCGKWPKKWRRGDWSYYTDFERYIIKNPRQVERFWKKLQEKTRSFNIEVKGEFGSSSYAPTIKYKGILFRREGNHIEIGTASRLRNTSVWHSRPYEGE